MPSTQNRSALVAVFIALAEYSRLFRSLISRESGHLNLEDGDVWKQLVEKSFLKIIQGGIPYPKRGVTHHRVAFKWLA